MKAGQESETAVMVCEARAAAHGRTDVAAFDDPTALALLPDQRRRRVERLRAGVLPERLGERLQLRMIEKRTLMVVPRTIVIDDAIRTAASGQLVILGAGLDGRAWRMSELADVTVFEVDHPDSQRRKQERAASLTQVARDVRFVPVDFARDRLDDALAAAGHDPARPTTWVWEGVVMYLTLPDIEATLRAIAARSAPASRIVVLYQSSSIVRRLVGLVLRLVGEPFRSAFSAEEMRSLLAKFGFTVVQDRDLATIAASLWPELGGERRLLKDVRIVTADLRPPA
jgi:methyltransferase (TIGR00027 family)